VPEWARGELVSVTRTREELSVVCADAEVAASCERGFRALAVAGPLDLELVGVLASLLEPLADAAIPVLALGTYDTDYLLVRADDLDAALAALRAAGHRA
jgi:hypothetical protein